MKELIKIFTEVEPKIKEWELKDETSMGQLGIDSIDMVKICDKVERRFSIKISDHEFANLRTFGDWKRIVTELTTLKQQ